MNVALYIRVSHDEQVMKGYSLEAQEKALREYAQEKNYNVKGVYKDEGFSAKKSAFTRPAMQKLLADLSSLDMILFIKLDRWFRNIKEYYRIQEQLEKHNVSWKAILEDYDTSTADGRLKVNIMLSVAENEADRTSERIRFVFDNKVKKGEVISGAVPFGYRIADKKLVKDENEKYVDEMFRFYLLYQNYSHLAEHMEKMGCVAPIDTWRGRLLNEKYTGRFRDNDNYCEPYITAEEHERIKEITGRNIKQTPSHHIYLFTGLIKCPDCGKYLTSTYGRQVKPVFGYRCPSHARKKCDYRRNINEEKLEKYLIEHIEEKYEIHEKFVLSQKTVKKERPDYKAKLKRLNNIYLNGNMSDDEYEKKSREIKQKIEEEKAILAVDEQKLTETKKSLKGLSELYGNLSRESKRAFWRNIIKEIHVNDKREITDIIFLY